MTSSLQREEDDMISNKPYLVRAFYEWIVDSGCTPYLVLDVTFPRCNVPQQYVENGQITLNIAPQAIRDLKVGNDLLEFKASFSGVVHIISAPTKAVLSVYAHENGQGMFFDFEDAEEGGTEWATDASLAESAEVVVNAKERKSVPHLKLVD